MKFGIFLNSQHPHDDDPGRKFEEIVEQVRLARQLGFDSIWGGEHHITDGYHYFPLLPMLQRLAGEAEGMELGTNIVLAPLHNPMELAEIGAFLDVITGGKFSLGVGLGYREEEFAMFGVPLKHRVSRTMEAIEIIRRLWTEDRVSHLGQHWQFENMTIRPQPAQRPRPPILVAAQVPKAIARAATHADGWCIVPTPRRDELAAMIDDYHAKRAAAGLDKSQHLVRLYEVACAESEDKALQRSAPYLLEMYAAYASWGWGGVKLNAEDAPEEQLRKLATDRFGIGTPEQMTDALMTQHQLGITHLTMRVSWPGMPQKDILDSISMIGTQVLPEVRKKIAAEH